MKVVILAGGMGSRISEESRIRPKPMIEIGGRPILWHIMNWYASFGYREFVICCGYKGYMIKDYFLHYHKRQSDICIDLASGAADILGTKAEPWRVTLVDTGLKTLTAGRILKIREYLDGNTFMLTYGDGIADVDIEALLRFHEKSRKTATITTTQPAGRFGAIKLNRDNGEVESFKEKARKDQSWVNAGFMVMQPDIFEYLGDGGEMLEAGPFEKLAADGEMVAYQHDGFWSPMDNIHDKEYLEGLWNTGQALWIPRVR